MWQGMRSFGAIVGSVVLAMVLAGAQSPRTSSR